LYIVQRSRSETLVVIRIRPAAAALDPALVEALREVDLPTIGHFLEIGFADPGIQRQVGPERLVGRAVTVRVVAPDSALVHLATESLEPGDVLVVDTGGDPRHAPIGSVTGTAIAARRAVGVVVDGPCTDVHAIDDLGITVFSRGTSGLTTKMLGLPFGGINVPVVIGGAPVLPGYVVIGDRNGLLLADPADVEAVLADARAAEGREPGRLQRLRDGEPLTRVSVAGERLRAVLGEPSTP
jgi:4-hydroxy-4-methyl-2-oxoglutarate aldolase